MIRRLMVLIVASLLILASAVHAAPSTQPIDFNRDIRPILSNSCYACHGFDSSTRQGDPPLRLDIQAGLFGEREGGVAPIVRGKPDDSLAFMRISSDDPEIRMPPPHANRPAPTPEQIELIRQWIEQGAQWKDHWAYVPPAARPAEPDVAPKPPLAPDHPIDRFITQTLEEKQLSPSAAADRVTLIRRLSFDLIGLPPTPEEADAFVHDTSPDAYEKLVDRLLASPHFGERMAVWWLDLVRYADTIGYHSDTSRDVWPYRDYVIKAFNENKRFDQFTKEQLAGDLLPDSTTEQKVASAYNRLLQTTEEGGAQAEEYIVKSATDRVRNVSSVWMGATLGCAQCHDHKYDPFSQKDFYQMAAFFADIKEPPIGRVKPELLLPDETQARQLKSLEAKIEALTRSLETSTPQLEGAQQQWEASIRQAQVPWTVLEPASAMSTGGATLTIQPDGSILASGSAPAKDKYVIVLNTSLKGITAIRIEALPHPSLPGNGPGRYPSGNFVLSSIAVFISKAGAGPDALPTEPVGLHDPSASFAQSGKQFQPRAILDPASKADAGWAIDGRQGLASEIVFQTDRDLGDGSPAQLLIVLGHHYGEAHALGHFRISATTAPRPVAAKPNDRPGEVDQILAIEPAQRTAEQAAALAKYYRSISPLLESTRTELAAIEKQKEKFIKTLPRTLITVRTRPRKVRLLARGDWMDKTGEVVTPAVPHFMRPIDLQGRRRATRLDLAQWLVSKDNPLTARVFVNRLWYLFYGSGIVKPLDDFGLQSAPPTHPDLLDWLATEFVDSGWDVKHMIRLMVTSGTYRQTSNTTPQLRETDPFNQYFARQGRFRLDAEFIRDGAMRISGLLVDKLGGPSVMPYQPEGYWDFLNFPQRTYEADTGEKLFRRALYTHWQRTFLNPTLKNFDAPSREECTAERTRSNTPQQALTLLDDPTYVEASRVFAEKVLQCGAADDAQRMTWAFKKALSREPRESEAKVLQDLLSKHLKAYRADPKAADALTKIGDSKRPADLDPAELAAWTNVTRVILNLHETISRL